LTRFAAKNKEHMTIHFLELQHEFILSQPVG